MTVNVEVVQNVATIITHRVNVKTLDNAIAHVLVDKKLSNRKLADLLLERRGIKVSDSFISLLRRGERSGKKPHGKRVLTAIIEELGIDLSKLQEQPKSTV